MSRFAGHATSQGPRLLGLIAVLASFTAVNARWIWLFRRGQPLDADEAGYLGFSMIDHAAFVHHGVSGFISALGSPGIQAPLTTALTALLFLLTGLHPIAGFAIPVLAGAGTIAATYFLGCTLGSRGLGLAAALLVASCPTMIVHARSFMFALPATCMATLALLALLRAERFRRPGWTLAFGLACALMLLSRTMTVAFLPGLTLGAVVVLMGERTSLARRALALAAAYLLGIAVAATWYAPNGGFVFAYLLKFGYGSHATQYGPAHPLFGIAAWRESARYIMSEVYLPHALVLIAGAAALTWLAVQRIAASGARRALATFLVSKQAPLVVFVAEASVALTSSPNKGTGFFAPIAPAAIALAAWACWRVSANRRWRAALAAAVALVSLLGGVPALDLRLSFARPWRVALPVLGPTTVTDGRSFIQIYETFGALTDGDTMEPVSAAAGRAWVALSADTAAALLRLGAARSTTAFGFLHVLYNLNTVRLAELRSGNQASNLIQVDPVMTGDTLAGDLAWLTQGAAAEACLLVTFEGTAGLALASTDHRRMGDAARQAGFVVAERWRTPDGQPITLWRRLSTAACRDG